MCYILYIVLRASWKISLLAKCCHPHKIKSLLTYLLTYLQWIYLEKQEMLQYVTDAPEGPLCDTPSHYALSFCDVSLNLLQ